MKPALSLLTALALAFAPPAAAAEAPTMAEAIELAARHNLDLALAAEKARAAGLAVEAVDAAWLPTLGLAGQGLYRDLAVPASLGAALAADGALSGAVGALGLAPGANLNAGLVARQLLFDGFALQAQRRAAVAGAEGARLALEDARQGVLAETASRYLEVLAAQKRLGTARRAVARAEAQRAVAESRLRRGSGTRAELSRAEAHLAAAQAAIAPLDRGIEAAWAGLTRLTGDALKPGPLAEAPALPPFDPALMATIADRLGALPAVAGRASAREAAEARAAASEKATWPRVAAEARYDRLFVQEVGALTVGVGVDWPLFDGFKAARESAIAASEARQAALAEAIARAEAIRRAREAYAALQAAEEGSRAAEAGVKAAQATYHAATRRYEAGVGTIAETIEADAALLASENGLETARYAATQAQVGLARALGLPIDRWVGSAE